MCFPPHVNNFTKPSSQLIDSFINFISLEIYSIFLKYASKKILKKYTFHFIRLGLEVLMFNSWNLYYFMSIIFIFIKKNRNESFFLALHTIICIIISFDARLVIDDTKITSRHQQRFFFTAFSVFSFWYMHVYLYIWRETGVSRHNESPIKGN